MQTQLKSTVVKKMANEAVTALEANQARNPGSRMAQLVRVRSILSFVSIVASTANVTVDLEDYLALTQLP